MKRYLLIVAFAVISGCSGYVAKPQQKPLTAVGVRDSAGRPVGEYRIVNTLGGTQTKERFVAGQMEGLWTFWDSRGTRTAEIHYHQGQPSGDFRLFYSALAFPGAAGRLKTVGHVTAGRIVGEHIGNGTDGIGMSRAILGPSGSVKAFIGTAELARELVEADYRLFDGLDKSIRDALQ